MPLRMSVWTNADARVDVTGDVAAVLSVVIDIDVDIDIDIGSRYRYR